MWTFETLFKYFEQQLTDLKELLDERNDNQTTAMSAALAAAEKAVIKAETATEKRFEGQNEFRQTLTDQAATFMTRVEASALINALSDKIEVNKTKLNELELKVANAFEGNRAVKEVTQQARTQKNITVQQVYGAVGIILVAIGIGVTMLLAFI